MSVPSGTGVAPSSQKSAVRSPRDVRKTYDYTLTVKPYPSGFNPPCQESNITIWELRGGSTPTTANPLNIVGGEQPEVNVGNCLAATGDSMHALLEVHYGTMRFIGGSGNFKIDSVDDSYATLTITDNTTGYSSNEVVYLSY